MCAALYWIRQFTDVLRFLRDSVTQHPRDVCGQSRHHSEPDMDWTTAEVPRFVESTLWFPWHLPVCSASFRPRSQSIRLWRKNYWLWPWVTFSAVKWACNSLILLHVSHLELHLCLAPDNEIPKPILEFQQACETCLSPSDPESPSNHQLIKKMELTLIVLGGNTNFSQVNMVLFLLYAQGDCSHNQPLLKNLQTFSALYTIVFLFFFPFVLLWSQLKWLVCWQSHSYGFLHNAGVCYHWIDLDIVLVFLEERAHHALFPHSAVRSGIFWTITMSSWVIPFNI